MRETLKLPLKHLSLFLSPSQLRLFHREHKEDLGSASRTVQQVIERTKVNIAWMRTNYDVIVEWLDAKGYSTTLKNA